ncbi:MAG: lipoyl synthase [Thermodesulfovibrionales bacterium]
MRLPDWIKVRHAPSGLHGLKSVLREHGLSTVCEEARCPNKPMCFSKPTATFMILGSRCTRNCGFCSVVSASPEAPDPDEPRRVALAAEKMGLKYVVITSVTRDDLPDGGAGHFARTVMAVRERLPRARVEVLTPDFQGDEEALGAVLSAGPDVFNHNVETVPSLYPAVRPQADYGRSLRVLRRAKDLAGGVSTKSGLMLGLGESVEEVLEVLADLRRAGCDLLTVGQYLRPSRDNLPVHEYVEPGVFAMLRDKAREMGFRFVASSPLARSSMNAEEMYTAQPGE